MFGSFDLQNINLKEMAGQTLAAAKKQAGAAHDHITANLPPNPLASPCCVGLCAKSSNVTCVVCTRKFCTEHMHNPDTFAKGIFRKAGEKYSIPAGLKAKKKAITGLGSSVVSFANASAASVEATFAGNKEYVCCWPQEGDTRDGKTCKDICVENFLEEFENCTRQDLRVDQLKIYLENGEDPSLLELFVHKKPTSTEASEAQRLLIAGAKTAEFALLIATPAIAFLGNMVLYGVQAKLLMKMLKESFGVENDMIELLFSLKRPLLHGLRNMPQYCAPDVANKLHNLTFPEVARDIVPSIFYLSRQHIFDEMLGGADQDWSLAGDVDSAEPVPPELFRELIPMLGPAAWLYRCQLPGVYSTAEWDKWYMQQVLAHDGWTVVGAMCRTSHVPRMEHELMIDEESSLDNRKQVYAEKNWVCPAFCIAIKTKNGKKEAVLAIRGSLTALDWTINLNNVPAGITYFSGPQGHGDIIEGKVHGGIYRGAEALLQHCHGYETIGLLVKAGYDLKIVGHSLGAGVATVVAMLLKMHFVMKVRKGEMNEVPFIPAVGFGVPPILDVATSQAVCADGLMVSVVHSHDIVPRLSESNIIPLAQEVFLFKDKAEVQLNEDLSAFKAYAKSMGAGGRMSKSKSLDKSDQPDNPDNQNMAATNFSASKTTSSTMGSTASASTTGAKEGEENAADKQGISSEKVNEELPPPPYSEEELVHLVVPGKIVMMAKGTNGKIQSVLCTHNFRSLNCIRLMDSCVDDHDMGAYAAAFASVSHGSSLRDHHAGFIIPAPQRPYVDGKFVPCGVCKEDVVWPFLTKSTASRAIATSNCALCGKIVCNVCAPAGELIPGDGIGTECRLADLRSPLPSQGLYTPQRLCLPCSFVYQEYY